LIGSFVAMPCSLGLLSLGRYRQMLIGNGAALLTTLVATVVLAKLDGAQGAAIATICGESVLAAALLAGLARSGRRHQIDGRVAAKLVTAGACTAPVALLLDIPSVLRASAAATLYVALVLISRSLPRDVFAALTARRSAS
jgi:O-antigen/teichoic acid export membrane protein